MSSPSSSSTTTYFWNFPFSAHERFAAAQEAGEAFQKSLQLGGSNAFVGSSAQVLVTKGQGSYLDLLMETSNKKDAAYVEEPTDYSHRLIGAVLNPWDRLFGSSEHLTQQQELVKEYASQSKAPEASTDSAENLKKLINAIMLRQEQVNFVAAQIGRIRQA